MDYEALYQQKLTTADEAVKVVQIGRLGGLRLVYRHGLRRWIKALAGRDERVGGYQPARRHPDVGKPAIMSRFRT